MATRICFATTNGDRPLGVTVEEDPDQVREALYAAGGGHAFKLTERGRGEIYLNPRTITYWRSAPDKAPDKVSPVRSRRASPG